MPVGKTEQDSTERLVRLEERVLPLGLGVGSSSRTG